jgi:hypothetical protein
MMRGNTTAERLAVLSKWIDDSNHDRDPEAVTWGRLAKVSEECGEVIAAFIGATGQNPRKGITHTGEDVVEELLDVALTALCAVEHLTNSGAESMRMFDDKVHRVCARAGLLEGGGRIADQSEPHRVSPALTCPSDAGSRERLDPLAATSLPDTG